MQITRFKNIRTLRDELLRLSEEEEYVAVRLDSRHLELDSYCLERMANVARDYNAAMVYCHYRERLPEGNIVNHPVIEYQYGSVRDDFDFGPLVVIDIAMFLIASEDMEELGDEFMDGGWYSLRLRMSLLSTITAVPEYMYTVDRIDLRKSGEKQHDYVDPKNADYQLQMEKALSVHLKDINAIVYQDNLQSVDFDNEDFPVEATVIIPVRNRVKTIADAVNSALRQTPDFKFNVIVVDNDSTDGTRELLESIEDEKLHIVRVSSSENLGIGGCWNRALLDEKCGRFAVQLDSDDMYSSENTLQTIVDTFRNENCAMVVGSYMMTDFDLNPIGPGLIAHREWTASNGMNNALRVNGFGAPRAFYTPIARQILLPNVCYGEDYAMALRISREWKIGRVYENLYFCRRWSGNSDAALTVEQTNANNRYKDFIRTAELTARILKNESELTEEND